ncbi:MAG: DegT/DnrJ/EryC1/StrS family aminotransferase [SAR324 cluster bacterium]|nr:DegT/DnrJ/EryC1/StrS family aminotransferase [SAR324 cluster bacterium]
MIPVSDPIFGQEEEDNLVDCIRTKWVSSEGKYVKQFEKLCAEYSGVSDGIAVTSGTTALQLAVKGLDLKEGSEIIVPSFTIISCLLAIIEAGLIPVLVDCDPETWCMDTGQIEGKITDKTSAIMVVHMYGHPVDMDPVDELAKKYSLKTIEDAAEAHGAEYKGRKCGALADVSILSFYANKLITTGEGGMVLTSDPKIADRVRSLRNMCFLPEKRFFHKSMGYNFRMSNLQAAVGVGQINKLDQFVVRKREMAALYTEGLKGLPIQLPVEKEWAHNNYWMYGVVLDDNVTLEMEECRRLLKEKGVDTRTFFIGMHEQPVLNEMGFFNGESYPVCDRMTRRGFYIPSGQAITNEQIQTVIDALVEILG